MDEERDEERVQRQLREIHEEFLKEKNPPPPQPSYNREPSPHEI